MTNAYVKFKIMKYALLILIFAGIMILPSNVVSLSRDIHVEWEYQYNESLAGFRLYYEGNLTCETTDPSATSMDCTIDAPDGESFFTLTSFFQDGTESPHSDTFFYIFSSDLKAILTADTLAGESPLIVAFDATSSTGNIVSYEWLFGDGETGSGNIVNHTFISAGNFNVILKVIDDTGAFDQETVSIVVTSPSVINNPPNAVISSSASVGDAPLQVQFDGTGSSDSDGTIISYEWDLGDGGTATGEQVTYTYSTEGTFNATLTITDNGGLTDTVSTPVIVNEPPGGVNIPPNAIISASISSGYMPLTVSFDAGQSNDPDGEIISYTWNFGDGTNVSGISVNHKFSQPAVYTVTLKVTDNMGTNSQLASYIVTVLDPDKKPEPLPDEALQSLPAIYYLLLKSSSEDEPSDQEE